MEDSQPEETHTPATPRPITELELWESLNRSLWEVERKRVEDPTPPRKQ